VNNVDVSEINKYFLQEFYVDFINDNYILLNEQKNGGFRYKTSNKEILTYFRSSLQDTYLQDKINNLYNENIYSYKSYFYKSDFKSEFIHSISKILNITPTGYHYKDANGKTIYEIGFHGLKLKNHQQTIYFDKSIYKNYFDNLIKTELKSDKVLSRDLLHHFVNYLKTQNIQFPNNIYNKKNIVEYGYNKKFKFEFLDFFCNNYNLKECRINVDKTRPKSTSRGFYLLKLF
jgi:hypothetical protein